MVGTQVRDRAAEIDSQIDSLMSDEAEIRREIATEVLAGNNRPFFLLGFRLGLAVGIATQRCSCTSSVSGPV